MRCRIWLGAAVLLAGCAAASHSQVTHDVEVRSHGNAFLQTREVAAWSVRSYADRHGDRWPTGLTLGARAVRYHDGAQERFLMLRKDLMSTEADSAVYEQVRRERGRLQEQCRTATLVRDGRAEILPVYSLTVRPLTNFDRMPVVATDTAPDPVEVMVGKNSAERFVISTMLQLRIEPGMWRELASAETLAYELCGETGETSRAELEALREVIAQSERRS